MPGSDSYPHLFAIDSPAQLRQLPESDLPVVAEELRQFLIDTVSQMGGHFAAGLGTVELTLALHYVYDTPTDKLVWDVGRQAYPHKVLTGRRDQLHTIKLKGGLAPFPSRSESEYDTFGVGHASTSISAALGMAIAEELTQPAGRNARRTAPPRRDHRRRGDECRARIRGPRSCRQPRCRPAGDPERQRYVDFGERRRAVELLRARALRAPVLGAQGGRQEGTAADPGRVGNSPAAPRST